MCPFIRNTTIFLLTAVLLWGCGNGATSADNQAQGGEIDSVKAGRKTVSAPVQMNYVVKNPIEWVNEEDTTGTDEVQGLHVSRHIIRIKGLRDQAVQDQINQRIQELYDELSRPDLPPYRGIKVAIPEGSIAVDSYLNVDVSANFGNVLSVVFYKTTTYAIPDSKGEYAKQPDGYYENTRYVDEIKALNLDLSTGEEIPLADVFADHVDYLNILSKEVSDKLARSHAQDEGWDGYGYVSYPMLKLTGPFKGISAGQNYYLSPYGIILIFDQRNPEFALDGFVSQTLFIPYSSLQDTVAVTRRYETDASLYLSVAPPVKSLVVKYEQVDMADSAVYREGLIQYYRNARYPSGFPDPLLALIDDFTRPDPELVKELENLVSASPPPSENDAFAYYEQWVNGNQAGSWYTIVKSIFGGYKEQSIVRTEYHTYNEACEELSLSELFVSAYDYRTAIKQAIAKSVKDAGGLYLNGSRLGPEESAKEIDRLADGVKHFLLSEDFVEIIAGKAEFSGRRVENIVCSLSYEEIGCDNLTIFH